MDKTACRDAMRQLVQAEYAHVYRFAYRLSGTHADAEDLTQQAFLQACLKLDQLRNSDRVRPWLLTITRNCFLKSCQRIKSKALPSVEGTWAVQLDTPWREEFDEEQLQQALNDMPEVFRTPVLLYYFEELSYREISQTLDVPMGTIMSRLARGKELLRARLMDVPEVVGSSGTP